MQARAIQAEQEAIAHEAARVAELKEGGFASPNEIEKHAADSASKAGRADGDAGQDAARDAGGERLRPARAVRRRDRRPRRRSGRVRRIRAPRSRRWSIAPRCASSPRCRRPTSTSSAPATPVRDPSRWRRDRELRGNDRAALAGRGLLDAHRPPRDRRARSRPLAARRDDRRARDRRRRAGRRPPRSRWSRPSVRGGKATVFVVDQQRREEGRLSAARASAAAACSSIPRCARAATS